MAARRRGTASTLTRGEVSMHHRQGLAPEGHRPRPRRRAQRSQPHGGGVAFGPKPRHYTVKVNRKARRKAMRAALSVHAERGSVAVLDAAAFETPSTKSAAEALAKWGAKRSTLVVLDGEETGALKSFRNIPRVQVAEVGAIGVADVIGAASLVISESALEQAAGEARADGRAQRHHPPGRSRRRATR